MTWFLNIVVYVLLALAALLCCISLAALFFLGKGNICALAQGDQEAWRLLGPALLSCTALVFSMEQGLIATRQHRQIYRETRPFLCAKNPHNTPSLKEGKRVLRTDFNFSNNGKSPGRIVAQRILVRQTKEPLTATGFAESSPRHFIRRDEDLIFGPGELAYPINVSLNETDMQNAARGHGTMVLIEIDYEDTLTMSKECHTFAQALLFKLIDKTIYWQLKKASDLKCEPYMSRAETIDRMIKRAWFPWEFQHHTDPDGIIPEGMHAPVEIYNW